jgi:putative transposase
MTSKRKQQRKQYSAEQKAQIVLELLTEEQTLAQTAAARGVHPTQLRKWKTQAVERLALVFQDETVAVRELSAAHEQEREALYAEIGRLTTELGWLKKNVVGSLSRAARLACVEWGASELAVATQAALLDLNRSGLYYVSQPPTPAELHIKRRIDEIYTAAPYYGYRKITAELRREMVINRQAVQRHMQEMGLRAVCPGPHRSRCAPAHPVFPYLLRGLAITHPNQVWGIDITYIRLAHGWLYLVAV